MSDDLIDAKIAAHVERHRERKDQQETWDDYLARVADAVNLEETD